MKALVDRECAASEKPSTLASRAGSPRRARTMEAAAPPTASVASERQTTSRASERRFERVALRTPRSFRAPPSSSSAKPRPKNSVTITMAWAPTMARHARQTICACESASTSAARLAPVVVMEETASKSASRNEAKSPERYMGSAATSATNTQAMPVRSKARRRSRPLVGTMRKSEPTSSENPAPARKFTTCACSPHARPATSGMNMRAPTRTSSEPT